MIEALNPKESDSKKRVKKAVENQVFIERAAKIDSEGILDKVDSLLNYLIELQNKKRKNNDKF